MAHSKTRTNDGKITYPPGVKEISDKISKEEMVRRLKVSIIVLHFGGICLGWAVTCGNHIELYFIRASEKQMKAKKANDS